MKFVYQYRTSDNVRREGVLNAPSRELVYEILRSQGIRPSSVQLAPGVFNRLMGVGKRWLAIGLLVVFTIVGWSIAFFQSKTEEQCLIEDRQQLYGDPAVLQQSFRCCWTNMFKNLGDAYLAEHAIPAARCRCLDRKNELSYIGQELAAGCDKMVLVGADDYPEIAKMKRMVNGMKQELSQYLKDGGSVAGYMERLDVRQAAERYFLEHAHSMLKQTESPEVWQKKNNELRAMGLPMVISNEL